jgi:hypothetical protein
MVDISGLVTILAPALPFLQRVGEEVAAEAGRVLGADAWERARRLWDRLAGAVTERPAAREAAADVAAAPQDADAVAAFRHQLRKLLEADPELARDVESLLAGARTVTAGTRGVAVGGDVASSVIVTGDGAHVERM